MKDKKTRLGINRKIVDTFHKLMLIVMLHSSFVAPSQNLISNYFNNSKPNTYIGSSNIQDDRNQTSTAGKINNNGFLNNKNKATVKNANENFRNSASSNFKIESDIQSGVIGVSNNNPLDDATDNLFKFTIDNLPHSSAKVFLKYDLYGVQDLNAVSRSINERPATGGYLVKIQNAWTSQKEELNSNWLQQGENKVVFSIPKNANFQYQVKNVRLEFDVETNFNSELVLHTVALNYSKDNKLYIKGFIRNPTSTTKVLAEQTALNILNGEFEGFINLTKEIKERKFVFINAYDEKGVVGQQIVHLDNIIEADKIFEIEKSYPTVVSNFKAKTAGTLITEGAKLIINDSALITDKEISITKLRSVDIAPLGSGMVNVTKGGSAFRFLPDGTTFKKPIQIALEYDENLLPKGHSANEIKTFYFNTNTKKWIAIERDTIDKENKSILSSTTHFTDYINGIIQTPESPETAGFTPTMMSDIKAVDPSSEMTLISPPEVSHKGDANVSYPIKIPAGRNGLQPQLAIQYNSDGGNGWLGEGWGLSTPSITIDTKWGTPTFNPTKESEIYTMSGEQLMYPKHNGKDWMPNRHFDVDGAAPGTFSTEDIDRTPNLTFTPRKQGSFTKIERLGNSTSNYYWKATSTNGTVYWYGGKDGVIDNAVIKNGDDDIVHWALYLVEDIHGNNIVYKYDNYLITGQSQDNENLNGGIIFKIKNIYYTGYNGNIGKYEIEFVTNDTNIRNNPIINNKNGIKQIDAFLLNQINIKNENNLIRKYKFFYNIGQFDKTLLESVAEFDSNDTEFYRHKFEYYNDLEDKKRGTIIFDKPVAIDIPSLESPTPSFSLGYGLLGASRLNTNQTIEAGWEIRPAIGFEIKWKKVSNNPHKTIVFGLPFGASYPKSRGIISMIDMDGNGLEDIVYKNPEGISYRPCFFNIDSNEISYGNVVNINGIDAFYRSEGKTQNKFFRSWDLKVGLPWGSNNFHVGSRRFESKNYTNVYFTDGNGDGLIDIVKNEQVVFNHGNQNGTHTFSSSSLNTPNMLITASTENIIKVPDRDEITDESGFETIRVWVAPKSGTIKINDALTMETINSESKAKYSIETSNRNINGNIPFRLYFKELNANNPTDIVEVTNYSGNSPSLGTTNNSILNVEKGQRIYFRLNYNSNINNTIVKSNPTIKYLNINNPNSYLKDENQINHLVNDYQSGFILNDNQLYSIPSSGFVKIEWNPIELTSISDDVIYRIIQVIESNNNLPDVENIIYQKTVYHNNNNVVFVSPQDNEVGNPVDEEFYVDLCKDTKTSCVVNFKFEVFSESNQKWKEIQWKPKLTFTPDVISDTNNISVRYPIADHSVYRSTFVKKLAPAVNWNTPNTLQQYGIMPRTNINLDSDENGIFNMIVKRNGLLVGKKQITIINGIVNTDNNPIFFEQAININNIDSQFEFTVGFYTDNKEDSDVINKYLFATNNMPALLGYDFSIPQNNNSNKYLPISVDNCYNTLIKFGTMYKEWGQFFYNDDLDSSTTIPFDEHGKLLNKEIIDFNYNISEDTFGTFSECDQYLCEQCTDAYIECTSNIAVNNLNLDDINSDNISDVPNNSIYNQINAAFLVANPTRKYINNQEEEKWKGIFDTQFTTETSFKSGGFENSYYDIIFPDENPNEELIIQADLETGMPAITKLVESSSVSKNIGWSNENYFNNATLSRSHSRYSEEVYNFLDVNGDNYPDILSSNHVKYTNKRGGFFDSEINSFGAISSSKNLGYRLTSNSSGMALGRTAFGTISKSIPGKSTIVNGVTTTSETTNVTTDRGNVSAFMNIPFDVNLYNDNRENLFWIDLNGDGLVDRIKEEDNQIKCHLSNGKLNTINFTNYSLLKVNESKPSLIAINLGANLNAIINNLNENPPLEISFSLGYSNQSNTAKTAFQDIDGDGLTDLLNINENEGTFNINKGNGFSSQQMNLNYVDENNITFDNENTTSSISVSGSVSKFWSIKSWLKWPKWLKIFHIKIGGSISGNANLSLSHTNKAFKDFNGDGFVDYITRDGNNLKVYYSRIKRTNKLKSVTNPLGGKFTIDYKVQPVDYDNPHAKWAMSQVIIEDGYDKVNDGVDVYKKNFVYEKGKYDRREREFYGYKTVKVEDYSTDDSGNEVIYRTSVTNYHNQSYFLNGLVENSYVIKGNDETKKYSKTINQYAIYGLNATNDEINLATTLPATYDVGGTEGRRSAAVLLKKSITELYELQASPQLTTEVSMKYDAKGRIVEYTNHGNVNDASDDYTSVIEYHNSMNALNIINVPKSIKVSTPTLGMVRERTTDVNSSNGTIVKINANNNDTWAVTKMEYDQYGNLVYIQYPENTAGEAMHYKYTYDADYIKYVTKISNAFGYSSSATYDSNFDKPLEVVDLTGNKMMYKYDDFGRNTIILAPKEIQAGKPYTIKFEYYPYISLIPSGSDVTASNFVPVAVTSHYDQQNPTNDIQTYTFVDGMARPIQVKKDIYYNTGSASDPNFVEALSVSGKTKFDVFARSIEQFHPYWEPLENNTKFLVNEYDSPYKSTVIYDELDRPIKNIDPEGNESTMEYTIDTDVDGAIAMKTKTDVDQNGAQHIISETFKDVSGRVISTNNIGGATGNIWTKFKYNEIGELVEYIDNEGIATTYKYDMFGRKIQVNHPDNGKTTYKYDNVNLVALQTANLESQGTTINYKYEINRLVHIKFPDLPSGAQNFANVTYKYGSSGNQTGRLIYQEDATGAQEMTYGNMGELITNVRTVVGPNIPTRQFKTSFQYDSWNRLQYMQYPDGEKITYKYDLGGSLTQMTGELNGSPYDYIKRIDYDYFEQRTYLLYGNNTETFYNYTPSLRRLNNLNVKTSDGNDLFNNNYEFDKVGNVTSLLNTAGITANDMAGNYSHNFKYDEFNRLAYAEGNFEGSNHQLETGNDANSKYALKMHYNTTHGIVTKTQEHAKNGSPFIPNTYDNVYKYITDTHKVEAIVNNATGEAETFKYDANGNITVRNDNNAHRELFWDESNRLRVVSDNHSMQHYIYDGSGERVLKANSDMEAVYENGELVNTPGTVSINGYTSYPSAFIVITADGVYSKHYYAGTQRIVSRLGDNDASIFENGCINCKQEATENSFDDQKLKQAQIQDLNLLAEKAIKGKITLKEYKPISIEEQEKAMAEYANRAFAPPSGAGGLYYYHPDHLGTSTALTDFNGNAYQFFLNLPFGETMAQQLGSNYYNSPFKFNGKELDEETGFYYYGARYYDPKISIWLSVDPLAEKYPNVSPYVYCLNNPINAIDPDGRDVIPVHGTWSNNKTWQDLKGITNASKNLFGDNKLGNSYGWSGGNYAQLRTEAALGLIDHVRTQMKSESFNGEITLVGHSHGGNVSIEALNMMAEMKEFDNVQLNLLTINTPVREDYQLSKKATGRVNHVNVYDEEDPVQSKGGKSLIILPDDPSNKKGTGEFGSAGRTFENAKNIKVDNPQGLIEGHIMGFYIGDYHNSHNRVKDWIKKTE